MASYQETSFRKRKHSQEIIKRNYFRKQVSEDRPDEVSGAESSESEVPFNHRVYYRPHQADGYDARLQWRRGENGEFYYDGREGTRNLGTAPGEYLHREYLSEYEADLVEDAYRALLLRDGAFSDEGISSGGPSAPIMASIYRQYL